jgi:hypothetical protein
MVPVAGFKDQFAGVLCGPGVVPEQSRPHDVAGGIKADHAVLLPAN